MEELLRLLNNFEYDRNKIGLLDDQTRYFLEDVVKISSEGVEFVRSSYEKGKEEGYEEGYLEGERNAEEEKDDILWRIEDMALNSLSEGGSFNKHQTLNKIVKMINPNHKTEDYPDN